MKKIRTIDDIIEADWEDIKRRREQGANLDQVGELYGITGTTLAKYARLAGVDIPRRTDYNPLPSIEDIQRLRSEGVKWADIAAKYHVSRDRLHSYAQEHGIDTRLVRKPTLTQVDWDDVKQMHKQGRKWTEIAKHIGVTTATLRRMMAHLALRAPTGDAHKYYDGASPYEKTLYSQTLCWSCANAVPDKSGKRGCAWSRSFKPVKGWDADETRLYSDKPTQSYHVRQCPEFVRG